MNARPPLVLALDLGTVTGWACGRAGDRPDQGAVTFMAGTGDDRGGGLYCALLDWMSDLHSLQHFERVVMEAPLPPAAQTHAQTARVLLGFTAMVETWCWRRDIMLTEASAPTVRAKVVGSGRAKKKEIIAWACAMGWEPRDHNAADALALLAFAQGVRFQSRPALVAA